jgi:hypothetical protein
LIAQQVKLMGPWNLKVFLSGYLAPIYAAKKVLNRKEAQDYRFTKEVADPEAKIADEEESEAETESDPDSDPEPTPDTSGEWQEQQLGPPSENKTQSREEPTRNQPQEDREVEKQTGFEEKSQEADVSQGPTHSYPGQPALDRRPKENILWIRLSAWPEIGRHCRLREPSKTVRAQIWPHHSKPA